MTPTPQWCERHWKPYAEKRANGVAAQAFLLKSVTQDDRWLGLLDPNGDGVSDTSTENMNAVFRRIAPACCWIQPKRMEAIEILATELNEGVDNTLDGPPLAADQIRVFHAWQAKRRAD